MWATPFDDRVEALFRPPLAELMALSPDGQRVAYTTQSGKNLTVLVMDVAHPGPKFAIVVDEEREVAFAQDKDRAQLRFLRWASPERLVLAPTEQSFPVPGGTIIVSPIMAVDADGKNPRTLVDARDLQETFDPPPASAEAAPRPGIWLMPHFQILGFLPGNRDELVFATRWDRRQLGDKFLLPQQYTLNIHTGKYREFFENWPTSSAPSLIVDEYSGRVVGDRLKSARSTTKWDDPELAGVQRALESKFPKRTVEILDWSKDRARVLTRVTGGSDPGRAYVCQRPENLVVEIFRRAPWLNSANLNDSRFFEFDAPGGAHLSGYLTWPNKPRLTPPPLIVCFPSGLQAEFDPEAQVLADLGFIVLRLNHRNLADPVPANLSSMLAGIDRRPADDAKAARARLATRLNAMERVAVDDALAAIEWVAERNPTHPFDRKRIATLGRGFGGTVALRAMQLYPDVFRCGIAIDAPLDLRPWLFAGNGGDVDGVDWKNLSVVAHADELAQPVFLLMEPAKNAAIEISTGQLRSRLKSLRRPPEYFELDPGFALGLPKARAAAYRKMDEFFNLSLYTFNVKVGPTKEVK